jgi:cleavage stimulation factor subunit 3
LTSHIYIAQALIEHHCYRNASAAKLFSAGMNLFPDDENLALEFIKHLIDINDITNARATFEKCVGKLTSKPETVARAKPLYHFFHNYESKYGEQAQISKLEQRMRDHFPDDPDLKLFENRFVYTNALNLAFDPTTIRPIISPATQMRLDVTPVDSVEQSPDPPNPQVSGVPSIAVSRDSPKRPYVQDGDDGHPLEKRQRGVSPLKGAAGRRLDAARRLAAGTPQHAATQPAHNALPRDINFLLGVLPRKDLTQNMNPQIIPSAMVNLLRSIDLQRVDWSRADLKAAGPGLLQAGPLPPRPPQQGPPPPMVHPNHPPPPFHGIPPQPPPQPPQMYSPVTAYAPPGQYPPASGYGAYAPPPMNRKFSRSSFDL